MKWWMCLFVVVLAGSQAGWSQTSGRVNNISLYEKDVLILGEGRRGPYLLPDSLILANSETIYVDGVQQPKAAYELDCLAGEIRFIHPVLEGSSIRLLYKRSPLTLRRQYAHRPVVQRVLGATTEPAATLKPARPAGEEDYAAQLEKSGSITRGVTVGTDRSLKVNSSLNVNVSGKVADNVEVVAALTDQTTPIQPEGTTQNLQEIDKVFVQIKSPHFSAILGDYVLEWPTSEFARYSRKLQGIMGSAGGGGFQFTASGAVSRGKFISQAFMGEEGNQGPYQLKGDRGQIDIIVLAGTERVYLDGEQLVRGETNDYVIDYAAAQITFTRRRLITADSRLVVDYQFSDEKFRRSLYSAEGSGEVWDGKLKFRGVLLHEADDKDNPLDFKMTDEYMQILRAAGDDPQKAVADGAAYVGPGSGRYVKNSEDHFVHVGQDSGDYRVTFSDVGQGSGDYVYKGAGIYEYSGPGAGRYAPVILLPTAKSQNLIDLGLQFAPVSTIRLKGEMALSSRDENTYSTIDDSNNQGIAQDWSLQWAPDSFKVGARRLGVLSLTGHYRSVQDRFQDIDRTTEVEYNRRWDLPSTAARGERVIELQGRYDPMKDWIMNGEFGDITKDDYFRSKRWLVESKFSRTGLPAWQYRIEEISKNNLTDRQTGDWWRQKGSANYQFFHLRPTIEYEGEVKKENWSDSLHTGFRFNNLTGGLEWKASRNLSASMSYGWRKDENYLGGDRFEEKSTALTQQVGLRAQQLGAFSGNLEYTHRQRAFADSAKGKKDTDLAEVHLAFVPWKGTISSDWNYQISNTATYKKERVYIKVSPGEGTYRYDEQLKEYVVDPLGDYVLRVLTTDDLVPVIELKTSSRFRLEPAKYFAAKRRTPTKRWQKWLKAFSSESFVAIEERTQEKDAWQIYLLNQDRFRRPMTTLYGVLQWRQDLFLFEHDRDFSLRFRVEDRDEINNQYLEGGQDRHERTYGLKATTRLSQQWAAQGEATHNRIAKSYMEQDRQNRDILGNQLRLDLSFRPKPVLELAVENRISREEDRIYQPATRVLAFSVKPRCAYSLMTKGRSQCELEWSEVQVKPGGRALPYEMADGRSAGRSLSWELRFDYRLSQTIQASISYTGRSEPERSGTIHTGRAQITAAFR